VLILRRFDRTDLGHRVGYISAMTALGATDGDRRDYAEVAEAIRDLSRFPKRDHHELFGRVVVSVALGNTDDHLRNHGFLADRGSWTLSPAFDVNPNPDLWRARATSIMGADSMPDEAEALLALAEDCGLTSDQARARMRTILEAFATWKERARSAGIREREIAMMADSIDARLAAVTATAGNA
jgi:serine/threonine-protein kinase HipA